MIKYVIKRDGRKKEFLWDRIKQAIHKAYVDIDGNDHTYNNQINDIEKDIKEKLNTFNKEEITVEEIQDIVVEVLSKWNDTISQGYQKYREYREEERLKKSKKEQFYKEVLECSNVDNDNANVDQHSFSGRKYRITDYE